METSIQEFPLPAGLAITPIPLGSRRKRKQRLSLPYTTDISFSSLISGEVLVAEAASIADALIREINGLINNIT